MLLAAQSMAVGTVMVRWVSKYSDPIMATGWVSPVHFLCKSLRPKPENPHLSWLLDRLTLLLARSSSRSLQELGMKMAVMGEVLCSNFFDLDHSQVIVYV